MLHVEQFVVEGLGHQSYCILDDTQGEAAVVDPRRDVDVYMQAVERRGLRITHILETHIHNDYISGARELAARTGATIVASAQKPLQYSYYPVKDGDRFSVGQLMFSALATPGHTPEHTSYLLSAPGGAQPEGLFSGGSLLVGNAGRTDLLGEAMTLTLTRQQYRSLCRLLESLPGQLRVYPTHGAGSFCMSTPGNGARTTTIAQERLVNPAALARNEDEFVQHQIAGYTLYPHYYRFMGRINQEGPRILGTLPPLPALSPQHVRSYLSQGISLIDGRQREGFARAHVPGSLNIELDDQFATYVGWILPFNVPLMLLIEDEAGRREAVVQLLRIGYEQVTGYLDGGITSWEAAALPVEHFANISLEKFYKLWSRHEPFMVLDVRRPDEWRTGHIPDAYHIHLGELPQRMTELPLDVPIAVVCHSGFRAEIAASMLAAKGWEVIAVNDGMEEWLRRGWPSVTSSAPATPLGSEHDH